MLPTSIDFVYLRILSSELSNESVRLLPHPDSDCTLQTQALSGFIVYFLLGISPVLRAYSYKARLLVLKGTPSFLVPLFFPACPLATDELVTR